MEIKLPYKQDLRYIREFDFIYLNDDIGFKIESITIPNYKIFIDPKPTICLNGTYYDEYNVKINGFIDVKLSDEEMDKILTDDYIDIEKVINANWEDYGLEYISEAKY